MHTRAGRKAKILALPNQANAHARISAVTAMPSERTPRRAHRVPDTPQHHPYNAHKNITLGFYDLGTFLNESNAVL